MSNTPQILARTPETSGKVPVRTDLVIVPKPGSTPMLKSVEMRRIKKHFVLNTIRETPGQSRAEIAKTAGLNVPNVATLVDELLSDGLVKEEEARQSIRGRRPIPVFINEQAASVLGIDIGKKSTSMILTNLKGDILVSFERPTPDLRTPQQYTSWASEVAEKILMESRSFMPPLCGIGVAVPGLVSATSRHLPKVNGAVSSGESWSVVEAIESSLKSSFGVEVLVDNDARLCVTGATWFTSGAAKLQNVAVLNVGFGLGLGVMINGQMLKGSKGFAGEIGHIPLGRRDVPCFCGRSGCLENIVSGAALSALAQERGLSSTDVEELAQNARDGVKDAAEIFELFADSLGKTLATIINLFDPELIILTGKVSRAADIFYDNMTLAMYNHSLPASSSGTNILVEGAGKNLSSLGAVAVVLNQIFCTRHISIEEIL